MMIHYYNIGAFVWNLSFLRVLDFSGTFNVVMLRIDMVLLWKRLQFMFYKRLAGVGSY